MSGSYITFTVFLKSHQMSPFLFFSLVSIISPHHSLDPLLIPRLLARGWLEL